MSAKRLYALDGIRGFALFSMVIYHAVWDLVYVFGLDWTWYHSQAARVWQQLTCCTFIFLSGFCQPIGKHPLKRGITILAAGMVVSAVMIIAMPENRIVFGVLTLIGSCTLLLIPLKPLFMQCKPLIGLGLSLILFFFTKPISRGYVGFENIRLWDIPRSCYCNIATTYLGFPMQGFYSMDYFSVFPWLFLFIAGYFLYQLWYKRALLSNLEQSKLRSLEWLGQHSLGIYLVHQPMLYAVFTIIL